jgi:hypothetical protein
MPHFNTHNLRASGRWVSPPLRSGSAGTWRASVRARSPGSRVTLHYIVARSGYCPAVRSSQHSTGRASLITLCPSGAHFAHHLVVATSEYAAVTPHHSLLIIHHGDPIPWPFRGPPSSYGPPASCRLGQGEAPWPNTCVLVSYWAGYIGPVVARAIWGQCPRAHAHDPHPGPRSGLGLSGARGVKRVHDGRRSLEQRPPRRAAAQPSLGRLKRRFNTAQQLVRDELDR